MIEPTNGRIVWFTDPKDPERQKLAAIICHVWDNCLVNLSVFSKYGEALPRGRVLLLQDGEQPGDYPYCEWMPFQKGQAAKHEAASRPA